MAALFHSTCLLNLKKRTYWPERSHDRGPPRLKFKLVLSRSEVSDIIGKLNAAAKSRAEEERSSSTQNSTKSSNIDLPETSCPDRLVLGLSANGPLNLQELKTAYRTCALKWHPDHHKGFSKKFAEEKFKICSAAYQSLYDKLCSR